jgi:hypothetical protein
VAVFVYSQRLCHWTQNLDGRTEFGGRRVEITWNSDEQRLNVSAVDDGRRRLDRRIHPTTDGLITLVVTHGRRRLIDSNGGSSTTPWSVPSRTPRRRRPLLHAAPNFSSPCYLFWCKPPLRRAAFSFPPRFLCCVSDQFRFVHHDPCVCSFPLLLSRLFFKM